MIQNVSLLDPSGIWGIRGATSGFHIFSSIWHGLSKWVNYVIISQDFQSIHTSIFHRAYTHNHTNFFHEGKAWLCDSDEMISQGAGNGLKLLCENFISLPVWFSLPQVLIFLMIQKTGPCKSRSFSTRESRRTDKFAVGGIEQVVAEKA